MTAGFQTGLRRLGRTAYHFQAIDDARSEFDHHPQRDTTSPMKLPRPNQPQLAHSSASPAASPRRRLASWLAIGAIATALLGCKTAGPLESFDRLEDKASQYGLIVVGAARPSLYENATLCSIRSHELGAIHTLETTFQTNTQWLTNSMSPQVVEADLNLLKSSVQVALSVGMSNGTVKSASIQTNLDRLVDAFTSIMSNAAASAAPSQTDTLRQKFATMKFLAEEEEDLRIGEILPLDKRFYRRIQLSVQLTALVHPRHARGIMVFLDLYPSGADEWCHNAGIKLRDAVRGDGSDLGFFRRCELPYLAAKLTTGTFSAPLCVDGTTVSLEFAKEDPIGAMHVFLEDNHLVPLLVHVEPLDEGEIVRQTIMRGSSRQNGYGLSAAYDSIGASLSGRQERTEATGLGTERVEPLSLAFAAGERRAGWLFLPSVDEHPQMMKRTERRIRMIIDVPKRLRLLAINVHKVFLNPHLQPVWEAAFHQQMRDLNQARGYLSELEGDQFYPPSRPRPPLRQGWPLPADAARTFTDTEFPTTEGWEIAKSRLRNSLTQYWSEILTVQLPDENEANGNQLAPCPP